MEENDPKEAGTRQYLVTYMIPMEVIVNAVDEESVSEDFADGDEAMLEQILEGSIPAVHALSQLDPSEIKIAEASESDLIRVLGESDPMIDGAADEEEPEGETAEDALGVDEEDDDEADEEQGE